MTREQIIESCRKGREISALPILRPSSAVEQIATEIARDLVRISTRDGAARLSLPLLYPGGSMVGVEISRLRDEFLVTDAGGARREAGLLGGERTFQRIAPDVAKRFAIRFDHNMMFDLDVAENQLISAVVAVANAAKTAVDLMIAENC